MGTNSLASECRADYAVRPMRPAVISHRRGPRCCLPAQGAGLPRLQSPAPRPPALQCRPCRPPSLRRVNWENPPRVREAGKSHSAASMRADAGAPSGPAAESRPRSPNRQCASSKTAAPRPSGIAPHSRAPAAARPHPAPPSMPLRRASWPAMNRHVGRVAGGRGAAASIACIQFGSSTISPLRPAERR